MKDEIIFRPIARIRTDFPEKFGIPRQSGLADTRGKIVFEERYRSPEAVRGIEQFSHLWLLWEFSEAVRENFSPTVRPPRLGGWECLPPALLSDPTPSGFPASGFAGWR